MNLRDLIAVPQNENIEEFRPGDNIQVNLRIVEGNRERIQSLDGLVIRKRGGGAGSTFTIRRVTRGFGVELTYPIHSPRLESVKVIRHGDVRRARLYYQRQRFGRAARIKERRR